MGELDVERHASGSNIHIFGDALWWAITTVTTVGYGDRFPVTAEGRVIATIVVLTGIAVLGVVTALIASWFVKMGKSEESQNDRIEAKMDAILAQMEGSVDFTDPSRCLHRSTFVVTRRGLPRPGG